MKFFVQAILLAATLVLTAAAQAQPRDAKPVGAPEAAIARQMPARSGPPAIKYHLFYDGKEWGPYTLADLKEMAGKNEFFIDDWVWKDGASDWLSADRYPELAFAPVYKAPEKPAGPAFYVDVEGAATGPFGLDELKAKAEAGELTAASVVWTDGQDGWKRAAEVEALKALFPQDAAPADDAEPATEDSEANGEPTKDTDAPVTEAETTPAAEEQAETAPVPEIAAADTQPEAEAGPAQTEQAEATPPPPPADDEVPPPPPVDQGIKYFVGVDGKSTGPFTKAEIDAKIAAGEISGATYLWWKGAIWTRADKVAEFLSAFADKPKPPPFDCEGHFIGHWHRERFISGQPYIQRVGYEPNGRFNGVHGIPGVPGLTVYGSWEATAVGEKACSLTMKYQYPDSNTSTTVLDIVDEDTMRDQADETIVRRIQ